MYSTSVVHFKSFVVISVVMLRQLRTSGKNLSAFFALPRWINALDSYHTSLKRSWDLKNLVSCSTGTVAGWWSEQRISCLCIMQHALCRRFSVGFYGMQLLQYEHDTAVFTWCKFCINAFWGLLPNPFPIPYFNYWQFWHLIIKWNHKTLQYKQFTLLPVKIFHLFSMKEFLGHSLFYCMIPVWTQPVFTRRVIRSGFCKDLVTGCNCSRMPFPLLFLLGCADLYS